MSVAEPEVYECCGVYGSAGSPHHWVRASEVEGGISLIVTAGGPAVLTPAEARTLARQLYALARRQTIKNEAAK